jgi:flagellar FliL protein
MAEEEVVAEKKGGNPMMIVLIVLIVILLAAVGGIGYFLYSKGMFDPEAQNGEAGAQTKQVQEPVEDIGETFQTKIDALVLNVTDAKGREKLMKLSFTIKSTEPTIADIVELNKPEVIDSVIEQISARSSEELLTVGGKALLKEEMISSINKILNDAVNQEEVKKDSVKNIFFTAFVIK